MKLRVLSFDIVFKRQFIRTLQIKSIAERIWNSLTRNDFYF
jgi:hypothetical protein